MADFWIAQSVPGMFTPRHVLDLLDDEATFISENSQRCPSCNHIGALHYVDGEWGDKWCHLCDVPCST